MSGAKLPFSRCCCRLGRAFCAVLVTWTVAVPAAAQTVWELTPYRVQVILAAQRAPELTAECRADLAADLLTRIDTLIGAAWDASVTEASAELRLSLAFTSMIR